MPLYYHHFTTPSILTGYRLADPGAMQGAMRGRGEEGGGGGGGGGEGGGEGGEGGRGNGGREGKGGGRWGRAVRGAVGRGGGEGETTSFDMMPLYYTTPSVLTGYRPADPGAM